MRSVISVAAAAALLAGCAQNPKDITPSYVSPVLYQNLTCQQLAEEGQRVSARAAELTGTQSQKASGDAVAMGVGLILFWPALFFIKGDKQTAGELGRLKGELDAIQQASIAKNCGISVQTYGTPATRAPMPAKP
jgi:hypothetical protein